MTRVTSNNHSYRPSVPHKEFKGFRKYINTHGHKFVFASILGIAASQAVKGFILKTLLVKASLILLAGVGLYKAVDTTFAIPPTGDITPPVATVSYSPDVSTLPQGLTNKDVNVILSFNEPALVSVDGVAISNGYVFNILSIYADNMTKVFTFSDVKGNTASLPVTVNYIDKIPPTANIEYQTLVISKKNVTIIATLTGFSEPITITNNGGSTAYAFTANGSFAFEFLDVAGNTGSAIATVDSLGKTACNQGIGNGPEFCDPGKSAPHGSSNDETGYHQK